MVGTGHTTNTARRVEAFKDTQMSETVQFMAGAGQTGTSCLLPSSRSDAQDGQSLSVLPFTDPENKQTGRSNQTTIKRTPHTE